jgi:ADP-heptose:LPS heptosyltransferase
LNSIARRIVSSGIHLAESLLRPSSLQRAAASHNILLPQFQTALGSMVHATPVVEALAEAVPQARIVVAGSYFAEQVYGGNSHVSAVLTVPSPLQDLRGAVQSIRAQKLFGGEPYTTLLTAGNERTKITLWSALAGPSRRIGYAVVPELVHESLVWDPAGSQISNNLRLLGRLGLEAGTHEPRIYPSSAQIAAAEERLVALGSPAGRRRIALVTQTSPTQHKGWRADRWTALAKHLIDHEHADLIFVGTASEAGAIDALRVQIGHPTLSVAGQTGIAELAAIFTRCDLGLTLDTGPLHVGRAVGLRMVVIAPAWSPVYEWLPVNDARYRILKNADFAPPAPDDYIIDEVSVDEVIAAAEHLARISADISGSRSASA